MPGQVAPSSELSDHEETLVENVSDDYAQKKANVQLDVVDCDLNDETHDAAVEHHEVPIHAHQEKIAEGVPLVLEEDGLFCFQILNRWPIKQMVDNASFLDVLLWLSPYLFDASHEELVHNFSGCLRSLNIESLGDGIVAGEELRRCARKSLIFCSHIVNRCVHLLHVVLSILLEEVKRNENLVGLQVGVLRAQTSDLTLSSGLFLQMPTQLLCRELCVAIRGATVNIVSTKAVIEDQDRYVCNGAEVCKFFCLEREPLFDGISTSILNEGNRVHDQGRNEEENDPRLL